MKPAADIGTRDVVWACAGLVLAIVPHVPRFSPWMTVFFAALAAWRVLGALRSVPLPDRRHRLLWGLKQLLAVAAFLAIYVTYGGHIGRDAGVTLLTALLGLKLLEMRSERDFYVVAVLGYFLVVTNFFYSQTLGMGAYMLFVVVVVTAGLVRYNAAMHTHDARACLRLAATIIAQALPLMAIAFVLFPRIPGPLWGLAQNTPAAVSGLSDVLSIGEIARLGLSDDIAFRVEFDREIPRAADRYWRGPVLWHTDGRTWTAGTIGDGPTPPVIKHGARYRYTVTLEPHDKRWLYALERVTYTGEAARETADLRLVARHPVKKRLRYTVESDTRATVTAITAPERAAALELPAGRHPRARELARAWMATAATPQDVIDRALAHFHGEPFGYTLTPPALTRDGIDEFLFTTRQGFCEHYAAAFVVLMRAAGIPARIVTGYQGGDFNALGEYLVIRQRDAHAWAEVYLDGRGWMRVDPTAAVAPERVALGIGDLLPARGALAILGDSAAAAFWHELRNAWDTVNYNWAQWVLGYSPQRQRLLLDNAGLTDWDHGTLVIALTVALALTTLLIGWLTARRAAPPADPARRAYDRFCAKLARAGIARRPYEGPADYARRVAALRADLAAEVSAITALYIRMRYAGEALETTLLAERVRQFTPAPAAVRRRRAARPVRGP